MATLTLLKSPYEISFAGNPLQFIWQVAPYGTREKTWDITATVRVLVENVFGSEIFTEVYLQKMYPDADGKIALDVSAIVSPYLDYYTPRVDLVKPVECRGQRKRYQVTIVYQGPDIPDLPPIFEFPTMYYAVKGGLAYEAWHYKEFFTKIILEDKKPLLFSAAKELVDPESLKYFYWLYPNDDFAEQTVTYKVYLSDGTAATKVNTNLLTSGKWAVNCAPCGFSQSGLDAIVTTGKYPVKYSVKVTTATATIVEEYFFDLDNRNFYEPYYIIYRNSIGGLESLRLLGQIDVAGDYAQQLAQRTVAPSWYNPHLLSQVKDEGTEETITYTGDTGFLSKEQEMKFRDLLLSKEKWMVQSGLLKPIALRAKNVKFFSNKDSDGMVSANLEWQLAYTNSYFTPGTLMPQSRSCPAVEKFIASQLTKNQLQFLYSLEDPYTDLEVQIITSASTSIYTYKGTAGKIIQAFDNPAVTDPVNITIKARTICNPDSVPIDYGPFATIVLQVKANSLPVAVDDHFTIPSGRTSAVAIPVSALANDYDPDGDEIEAVADWGITTKGAVWTIDSKGFITFLTNFQNFTGEDYFDYQIHEIGSDEYVTGRVYITVGDGPQRVFVKWVFRNVENTQYTTWAEAWLDYYSDPACTIPVDISSLGLTIGAMEETFLNGISDHVENYSFVGSGTKKLMWSGYTWRNIPGNKTTTQFTVLPGVGYTEVN